MGVEWVHTTVHSKIKDNILIKHSGEKCLCLCEHKQILTLFPKIFVLFFSHWLMRCRCVHPNITPFLFCYFCYVSLCFAVFLLYLSGLFTHLDNIPMGYNFCKTFRHFRARRSEQHLNARQSFRVYSMKKSIDTNSWITLFFRFRKL